MNIDALPSWQFHCGRCARPRDWNDFTAKALERSDGDGDPGLICRDCRATEYQQRMAISRQIRDKAGTARRAEARVAALETALGRAARSRTLSYTPQPATYSERDLCRRLAEATRALAQHHAELAALREARAAGATERTNVRNAINPPTNRDPS